MASIVSPSGTAKMTTSAQSTVCSLVSVSDLLPSVHFGSEPLTSQFRSKSGSRNFAASHFPYPPPMPIIPTFVRLGDAPFGLEVSTTRVSLILCGLPQAFVFRGIILLESSLSLTFSRATTVFGRNLPIAGQFDFTKIRLTRGNNSLLLLNFRKGD